MPEQIQVLIPANIRFKFYETPADVKLENKFASLPLAIPLAETMKDAYGPIGKVTKELKSKFGYIYAGYALTQNTTLIGAR